MLNIDQFIISTALDKITCSEAEILCDLINLFKNTNKVIIYSQKPSGKIMLALFYNVIMILCSRQDKINCFKWINCQSEELVILYLRSVICSELGLEIDDLKLDDEELFKILKKKFIEIKNHPKSNSKFIIMFYNCNQRTPLEKYINLFEAGLNAQILITTNDDSVNKENVANVIRLDQENLFFKKYLQLKYMDPNDLLLLKWLTAFQQEFISFSISKAILEFNQNEKMLDMNNQDDNSQYVLANLSFDSSFSFVDAIKRLFKNHFISEIFSNNEKYIKLNYCSFLEENFISDVERLKYRILILFSNQLEISISNYEAFTPSIKIFYQCLITLLQQTESEHLDNVDFQIKISNLYQFLAVFNDFNLYDRNTQLNFMFKCNEIRKKHRLKYADGDKRLSESFNNTGIFYTETDSKKAIGFFVESLDLRLNDYLLNEKSTSSMHGICLMHSNLGKLYFDNGNKSKAHFHFQNVLAFSESLGKLPFVHLIQNISSMYEAEYAIKLLNVAIYVSNTRVDDEENLFFKSLMYLKMGINLDNLNKSNEALEAFDFALALSMYKELKYENKGQINLKNFIHKKISLVLSKLSKPYVLPDDVMSSDLYDKDLNGYDEKDKIHVKEALNEFGIDFMRNACKNLPNIDIQTSDELLVKSNLEIEELLKEGQQHKSNGNSIPELLSYLKALELTDKAGNLMKKVKIMCALGEYFEQESSKADSENLKTHLDFLIRAYKLLNEIEENKDYQDYKLNPYATKVNKFMQHFRL
jgi:hypothetical protein